jgi:hypothetical protein
MSGADIEALQFWVDRDIESWFSATIRCCDNCYPEFVAIWPGTAHSDTEFQKGMIDIDSFVRGSRLSQTYSPAELSTARHYVRCPRCDEYVQDCFWAFEHGFDDDIRAEIDQLTAIARRTPFLLLLHPFPKQVLDTISRISRDVQTLTISRSYFRARRAADVPDPTLNDFGPPPAELVEEGRYNHSGSPMLYLAGDLETAFREIAVKGEKYAVAELHISAFWKILDLIDLDEEDEAWPLLAAIARSALGAAPRTGRGWLKREYVFTRFVGDCAKSAGFDGIRYGSTKGRGENIVLLEPERLEYQGQIGDVTLRTF